MLTFFNRNSKALFLQSWLSPFVLQVCVESDYISGTINFFLMLVNNEDDNDDCDGASHRFWHHIIFCSSNFVIAIFQTTQQNLYFNPRLLKYSHLFMLR